MKIGVVGIGYVGLTYAIGFSYLGNDIIGIDVNANKINDLKKGILPIYDDSLNQYFQNDKKDILFSTDYELLKDVDAVFICVGTPQSKDGSADLSYLWQSINMLKRIIKNKYVFIKSTVPVGTNAKAQQLLKDNIVISNPEFLRQGNSMYDFLKPSRLVFGINNNKETKDFILKLFNAFKDTPIVFTNYESAELIKYASNSFLALKISFMNELARLCYKVNADINDIKNAMGLDPRIGPKFLNAGIGYGGSCFPKDVKALIKQFEDHGLKNNIVSAVDFINETQVQWFIDIIKSKVNIKGKKIAVLGLAFKPNTDDIRTSKSIEIIEKLLKLGANVKAFDYLKMARENTRKIISNKNFKIYDDINGCLKDVDYVIIATEYKEFNSNKVKEIIKKNRIKYIFDGRNIISNNLLSVNYLGVGRK